MLWFRIAAVTTITMVLAWSLGEAWSIISMFSYGGTTKSMVDDPSRNGTVSVYLILCSIQFLMAIAALFGLFIAFRMWRNNYQIDHSLRHLFILWLGGWAVGCVMSISMAIYMITKAKDNQENMAVLFDTFQKNAQDQKFVSTLEKYQRENQCCGVYSPDDWLMLQLRQAPVAGGGGGGYQSLDYGFRQNPSTGKCHMVPPSIPPGCGIRIWDEIQVKLKTFAAVSIAEIILAGCAGALSWYCFFYWLEKEVIVIPEDEVSNVIIIEPESEATVVLESPGYLSPAGYMSRSRGRLSGYLQSQSRRSDNNNFSQSGSRAFVGSRMSGEPYHSGGYLHGSGMHGSTSRSRHHGPQLIHLSHSAILKEQEEALGGHVLAEMHIEHKKTKMLKSDGSKAGVHHATVALVRNKNPPKPQELMKKGHHGQTGNLAQDIADMSGGNARGYIEDVVIPLEPPGVKPHPIQVPIGATLHSASKEAEQHKKSRLGVASHEIGAFDAQNLMEGVLAPGGKKNIPSVVAPGHHDHHEHEHGHGHHDHSKTHELDQHGHHNPYLNGSVVHHEHHDPYLHDGGHHHDPYLHDGGHHHEHHDRYLHDGGHHHEHHDRYLHDGGHHHDRYLHDGGHHHEHHEHHDRYLHDGGHHHHHHEHHDRYLPDGGHHGHHGHHDGGHHDHHPHHSGSRQRELPKGKTTVIFKNSKPLDESD